MGGFIVLQDGRAYAASNFAFRTTIRDIAAALPETGPGRSLARWLTAEDGLCLVHGSVDLRELTTGNQDLFEAAARSAFAIALRDDPDRWADPSFYAGWLARFGDLLKMMESIRAGEPPSAFNPHMSDIIEPTGQHSGPGWDF